MGIGNERAGKGDEQGRERKAVALTPGKGFRRRDRDGGVVVEWKVRGAEQAALQLSKLVDLGPVAGKLGGAWIGGVLVGAPDPTRRWLGLALLPQAGVALGLALEASERFPELADDVLPIVIVATVIFEVAGTLLTQLALNRATADDARSAGSVSG